MATDMTTRAREVCRELLEELKHGAALQAHLANDPVLSESMRQSYARVAGINHDRASALSALIAECEWLPIASAPKDGDCVLLLYRGEHNYSVDCCYWDANFDAPYGAWVIACECDSTRARFQLYTHWRPLPPPPTHELITGEVGRDSAR